MAVGTSMDWWRESRFGMFIHWGLYSIKAKGEWVMYIDRIPVREYEKLAQEFNPDLFNADEWVALAKRAGMKYIVFTTKHHDGFSMFKTEVDGYNIVDATPLKRDVVAELSEACRKHGLRLCFYYSHVREWRHPHAQSLEMISPSSYGNFGNFWDYPDENRKNLQTYIDEFDKPQLRELLSQYGPVGIIWFDTSSLIRPDQAQELIDLIKGLQPECLVNSRVGDFVNFDYHSLGDDEVPDFNKGVDFETPMTICDFWGYNTMPGNRYRDVGEMLHQLVDIVSLGGNYLLNVGPDPRGVIPMEAQDRLGAIGKWMEMNGEAIYATKASPFPAKPSWGRITAKQDALYLHIYDWTGAVRLTGIKSTVKAIVLLADPERTITWTTSSCGTLGYDSVSIFIPGEAPDAHVSVVKVQFGEPLQAETGIIEDDFGVIQFPACLAKLHTSRNEPMAEVNITGVVRQWLSTDDWFSWEFLCEHPGAFDVSVTAATGYHGNWDFGHELMLECEGQALRFTIEDEGLPTGHYQKRTYPAGRIQIDSPGLHRVSIKAMSLTCRNRQGFQMSMINLRPTLQSTFAEVHGDAHLGCLQANG